MDDKIVNQLLRLFCASLVIFAVTVVAQISEKEPTIVPFPNFNPEQDAKDLHKAMGGIGIGSFKAGNDMNKVINIIAGRTNFQRQKLNETYHQLFKRNLVQDLKSNSRGEAENFFEALMTPAALFDAHLIHHALKWLGTDYNTLLEVLVTRSPAQLKEMAQVYQTKYKKSMIKAINGDVHGKVEKFLDHLLAANKDVSNNVDQQDAYESAKKLATGDRITRWFGGKDDAYINILGSKNHAQLKLIFEQFQLITRRTIEEDILKNTRGKFQQALLKLVETVRSSPQYFAERLHKAVHGLGTDNAALIRILTTRSEVDLNSIKNAYFYKYKEPLEKALKGDVSGIYQRLVLAVLRGNRQPYMVETPAPPRSAQRQRGPGGH